ncbi:PP2C family protein-serine/threonine phosphatase [Paracoccus tibetensis]|uniref:HAMP domain-containing protein n=1 Tax=Paracoccus tibetensis TaxID=336292 RepID=A0A1G5JM85_9RHOB|nr:PP2C family protein-serine/threonine phosphatase [Paracoccus tibetensis]SCY88859.1 HAMP domain-containing protein [Paracoccus tibetensis]
MPLTHLSIRNTLLGLTGFLGGALMIVVAVQVLGSMKDRREMDRLVASNLLREQLAQMAAALAVERSETVLSLAGSSDIYVVPLRQATDHRIAAITQQDDDGQGPIEVFSIRDELAQHRAAVDAAQTPEERAATAAAFNFFGVSAVNRLSAARIALLVREQPADPVTALAFSLRSQASTLLEYLIRSRTMLALNAAGRAGDNASEEIQRNAVRIDTALAVLRGNPELLGSEIADQVQAIEWRYYALYRPAEVAAVQRTGAADPALAEAAVLQDGLRDLLALLFSASRAQLFELRAESIQRSVFWSSLFFLAALAVVASVLVVRRRIVTPLSELRTAMLELAEGRQGTALPASTRQDEMTAMTDALRVFRANDMRRRRLQDERLALHDRLKEAYRQLKLDLEAAAVVQATLLPPSARLGGLSFYSYFRPSRFIAGDTFNVVRRSDGLVDFFEIDVAGHGAPAALISVASHHSIAQAALQRRAGEGLADLVASINAEWPDSFPYFTMILGEIDPASGKGRLVQAGHPAPLLIVRTGDVREIGDGGLPVGIIPHATYDVIEFDLRPGDRLLLYSDGLTEAEDLNGQFFSQERLIEIVTAHAHDTTGALINALDSALRNWRGSGTLDDDVTVLILEAEVEHERA